MVAAGRAVASRDPKRLIDDPFAAPLVRAVGIEFFAKLADGELDISDIDPESAPRVQANIDEMAVRTKFFDDYFASVTAGGIRQAVILTAGLDARAYRLAWPAGTVVYEARIGASPVALEVVHGPAGRDDRVRAAITALACWRCSMA